MSLLRTFVDRSRASLSMMVLVLVAGIMSQANMPVELNPNITVPAVIIMVRHDGISPEDGTRLLVRPIEKELKTLDGLEELNATARESTVSVFVEFDINLNVDKVIADVREAVDRAKAEFPNETKEPIVKQITPTPQPDVVVTFSGEGVDERDIYKAAKFFQRKIEGLLDVLQADLTGHRDEVAEVILDPSKLDFFNITADELVNLVAANNLLIPAGEMDTAKGRFGVKVPGLIETVKDIRDLPIRSDSNGAITLNDIATVRRTFKDATEFSTINGESTIAINVRKRMGANAIEAVAAVREVVDSYRDQFSKDIEINFIMDSSEYAQGMVDELMGNILTAMALVLVLVVATLGTRSGALVGFGIPFSLIGAMIIVNLMGASLNFMVMFGLLLALGMLIDGAIVVVEFANTNIAQGLSVREAYLLAVRRMRVPVIASTGTTLAAFLPMLFWPGVSGSFMFFLPATVFSVLAWSLIYALIFAPILGIALARRRNNQTNKTETAEVSANTLFQPLLDLYLKLLRPAVANPVVVVGLVLLLLISVFQAYGKYGVGMEFFPETENRYGVVVVRAQGNLSIAEQRQITARVEQRFSEIEGIEEIYASSQGGQMFGQMDASRDQISLMLVQLTPRVERDKGSSEIFAEIRELTANMPGIYVIADIVQEGPPVGKDIQIQISSNNAQKRQNTVAMIRDWMDANVDGLRDIEDTLPLAGIEWEMVIDRAQAAMMGVNVITLGQMVQLVTNGMMIGEFRPDDADQEVEIRVRYPKEFRNLQSLDSLKVNTFDGPVSIGSFTERRSRARVDTIQRINMLESTFIFANSKDGYITDNQVKQINQWLTTVDIDPSINIQFRGANEEQTESAEFLSTAFALAMGLMLILLVAQFNSYYQALLILFSVVISTAGVLLGLLISQSVFSTILTGVGIVALAGIVVNNNIVLIDSYNFTRRNQADISAAQAAFKAAKSRFRPVMLTTVTTVVGLLPLASGYSVDIVNRKIEYGSMVVGWWQPMASAVVNGLLLSTFMTLLVTPALLVLPGVVARWLGIKVVERQYANTDHKTTQ